jgi:hypothetical protein
MAIWRRQFFHQEMGDADDCSYSLACDTTNGHIYIISGLARPGQDYCETHSEIADLLAADSSAAKHALLQLIGTLVHPERQG